MNKEKVTTRPDFLERFLGKKKKDEIVQGAAAFEAILDGIGINRKEKGESGKRMEKRLKGLLEELQPAIMAVLDPLTDNDELKAEAANQTIAVVMGTFATEAPEEVEEEPLPEEAAEIMEDDEETVVADDEEEEEEETIRELSQQVIVLAKESAEMYKFMNELVPLLMDNAKTIKALTPLVDKVPDIVALKTQMAELEKATKMRPRIASQDNGTEIKKGDDPKRNEVIEKLEEAIKQGTDNEKYELGVRVKG